MINKEDGLYYSELYKGTEIEKYARDNIIDLFDRHHLLYISEFGPDIKQNITEVRRPLHNYIHDNMRIPSGEFNNRIRKIREASNHKIVSTKKQEDLIYQLQKRVHENLYDMPIEVVRKYENNMLELLHYRQEHASKITNYNNKQKTIENRHIMHSVHHEVKVKIAEQLGKDLKKKYL